jgi:predicted DNA-binding transcriptional regulator AlpA
MDETETFTLKEFLAVEKISRSYFYKLEQIGKAPRTYNIGRTRRVTGAARREWRAALEAESGGKATVSP